MLGWVFRGLFMVIVAVATASLLFTCSSHLWCVVYEHWREAPLREARRASGALPTLRESNIYTTQRKAFVSTFLTSFHTNWDLLSVVHVNGLGEKMQMERKWANGRN